MSCFKEEWSAGIGDPSVMGWLTVAAYAAAAFLSARHYWQIERRLQLRRLSRPGTLWLYITVLMIFLTLNKQLDLQSAITGLGKCMAKSQGWYSNRQAVQIAFLSGIGVAMSAVIGTIAWKMRDILQHHRLVLLGLFILLSFVMMRALSFHYFDQLINTRILDMKLNWMFELSGIFIVSVAAYQKPTIVRPMP